MAFNSLSFTLSGTGKPPKFEVRKMDNKAIESGGSLVIPEREYEIEPLPSYQEHLVTPEENFDDDFGSTRQTKSKSVPSDDNFDDDFGYVRKTKGKTSVPGRSPVRVYTYQVSVEIENMLFWIVLL